MVVSFPLKPHHQSSLPGATEEAATVLSICYFCCLSSTTRKVEMVLGVGVGVEAVETVAEVETTAMEEDMAEDMAVATEVLTGRQPTLPQ